MVCELPLAIGLGLFSYITALRRFCFNILCVTSGPAFAFSDFDVAGGLGLRLTWRHRALWFGIADIAKCCFNFLTEDGLRIIRNVSK